MKKIIILGLLISSLALAATDGGPLMQEEEKRYNAQTEHFQIRMQLIAGLAETGQSQQQLTMQMWLQNRDGLQSSLIKLTAPADLRGTALLTVQQSATQSDQWIYLPDSGITRRILAGSKADKFLSSDLTFGDLEPETLERWQYQVLAEEKINNSNCWVIEARPRNSQDVKDYGYSKRKLWLQQSNYFVVKIEYYDREGVLAKVQENQQVEQVSGYWRSNKIVVRNLLAKHLTILTFSDRQINPDLPEGFFSKSNLER